MSRPSAPTPTLSPPAAGRPPHRRDRGIRSALISVAGCELLLGTFSLAWPRMVLFGGGRLEAPSAIASWYLASAIVTAVSVAVGSWRVPVLTLAIVQNAAYLAGRLPELRNRPGPGPSPLVSAVLLTVAIVVVNLVSLSWPRGADAAGAAR